MTKLQQLITEVKALPEMQTVVPESMKTPKEAMFDICKDENGIEVLAVSEAYGGEILGEEYKFSEIRQQFYSKTYPVISPEEIKATIQKSLRGFAGLGTEHQKGSGLDMTRKLFTVEVTGFSEPINILHDSEKEALDFITKTILTDDSEMKIVSEHIPTEAEAEEAQSTMNYMLAVHSNLILKSAAFILLELTNMNGLIVGSAEFIGQVGGIRAITLELAQHGGICEEFSETVRELIDKLESANLDSADKINELYKEVVKVMSLLLSEHGANVEVTDAMEKLVRAVS